MNDLGPEILRLMREQSTAIGELRADSRATRKDVGELRQEFRAHREEDRAAFAQLGTGLASASGQVAALTAEEAAEKLADEKKAAARGPITAAVLGAIAAAITAAALTFAASHIAWR